eukprot:Skav220048  [mRNA]  locus=scaffold2981:393509:412211:- [translate_table: standard]
MGCNNSKPAEEPGGKESAGMGRAQFIIDNPGKILDFYDLDKKKLGEGSYGYVCKGKNKATNAIRAVKTIAKGKMKNIERFKQEIPIMKMMDRHIHASNDHPNIIKLNIYLVMELCSGGELFDRIIDAGMSRMIWVRSEVFDHGVFNTSIRWSSSKVMNFISTLQSHMNATTLSKEAWLDLSVTRCKPALTETEASTYWTVFSVLQQSILGDPGDVMDIRLIGIVLICQIFSSTRAKESHAKSEVWNERAPGVAPGVLSPRNSPRTSGAKASSSHTPSTGRGLELTQALHSFVKQHLGSWLQIASLSLQSDPAAITAEEFDVLGGLILCGGSSKTQPLWKLSSMPSADLRKAVLKLLVWNEDVYTLRQMWRKMAWTGPPGVFLWATSAAVPVTHHAMSVTVQTPEEPRAKTLNISNVLRGIWFHRRDSARQPHNAEIEYLNIADCKDSTIYVTARIRYCLITGCESTTIILGVSTICTTHNCEKVSVHVAAHCYKMENCIDTSAYCSRYCHIPPIITGDTRGHVRIKLAPYNVLHSHMASVLHGSQDRIQSCFKDWLQSTGKVRQLSDLAKFAAQFQQRRVELDAETHGELSTVGRSR